MRQFSLPSCLSICKFSVTLIVAMMGIGLTYLIAVRAFREPLRCLVQGEDGVLTESTIVSKICSRIPTTALQVPATFRYELGTVSNLSRLLEYKSLGNPRRVSTSEAFSAEGYRDLFYLFVTLHLLMLIYQEGFLDPFRFISSSPELKRTFRGIRKLIHLNRAASLQNFIFQRLTAFNEIGRNLLRNEIYNLMILFVHYFMVATYTGGSFFPNILDASKRILAVSYYSESDGGGGQEEFLRLFATNSTAFPMFLDCAFSIRQGKYPSIIRTNDDFHSFCIHQGNPDNELFYFLFSTWIKVFIIASLFRCYNRIQRMCSEYLLQMNTASWVLATNDMAGPRALPNRYDNYHRCQFLSVFLTRLQEEKVDGDILNAFKEVLG